MCKSKVFYDSACNLCLWSVRFIMKRDKAQRLLYIPIVSADFEDFKKRHHILFTNSIIYFEEGNVYQKSSAVLRILRKLGGLWKVMYYVFSVFPSGFSDRIYDQIAVSRYRWFGRTETCALCSGKNSTEKNV
ncbi:MAG: DUF393 domain-containing protein [Bacteroidales bacterium]|nr:DUF393 domain-containing protein [Bacteroidales bacterium]